MSIAAYGDLSETSADRDLYLINIAIIGAATGQWFLLAESEQLFASATRSRSTHHSRPRSLHVCTATKRHKDTTTSPYIPASEHVFLHLCTLFAFCLPSCYLLAACLAMPESTATGEQWRMNEDQRSDRAVSRLLFALFCTQSNNVR